MKNALIALHFQNDICHPDGLIPFAVDRDSDASEPFLARSRTLIGRARAAGWLIVHVHIAFKPDYSDLPRNGKLFLAAETLGALKQGSWGAAPMRGFEPETDDLQLVHTCNNAFQGTGLEELFKARSVTDIAVAGLATQYSVEHTVRHAADLGYRVIMVRDCCGSANAAAAEASFSAMAMLADIKDLDDMVF